MGEIDNDMLWPLQKCGPRTERTEERTLLSGGGGGMVCQCIPLCVPTCKHVCVVRERCECVGRFKKERHAHARKA